MFDLRPDWSGIKSRDCAAPEYGLAETDLPNLWPARQSANSIRRDDHPFGEIPGKSIGRLEHFCLTSQTDPLVTPDGVPRIRRLRLFPDPDSVAHSAGIDSSHRHDTVSGLETTCGEVSVPWSAVTDFADYDNAGILGCLGRRVRLHRSMFQGCRRQ